MSSTLILTTEIEFPDEVNEKLLDAMVDDLTCELNLARLRNFIKQWTRQIAGANCHITIETE